VKPIRPYVVTRVLSLCNTYTVGNYACGAINNFIKSAEIKYLLNPAELTMFITMPAELSTISRKPSELLDLLGACGANDVYYYACGTLLRFQQNLRSSMTS